MEDDEVDDEKEGVESSCTDSGCKVVEEEAEPSVSDVLPDEGECGLARTAAVDSCRARMLCAICDLEKERWGFERGVECSTTVLRIAVVISSCEVYGKHTFKMAFVLALVICTARSMAS